MSSKNLHITNILERLKKALGVKKDVHLSNILGVKPSTLATWKLRGSLDYELIIAICKDKKINLNWLFTGHGSMFIEQEDTKSEKLQRLETRIKELIKEKDLLNQKITYLDKELQELDAEMAELKSGKSMKPF